LGYYSAFEFGQQNQSCLKNCRNMDRAAHDATIHFNPFSDPNPDELKPIEQIFQESL